jgi:hypothetical protein
MWRADLSKGSQPGVASHSHPRSVLLFARDASPEVEPL